MVVGFDVYHGKGMRSFGAMAATTGKELATYYSTVNEQSSGVEMATEIGRSFYSNFNFIKNLNLYAVKYFI
jgi:hypothetical protein